MRIVPFYDRIELITAALDTVYKALLEGIVLVVVIVAVLLLPRVVKWISARRAVAAH